jgi:hypothetical protein
MTIDFHFDVFKRINLPEDRTKAIELLTGPLTTYPSFYRNGVIKVRGNADNMSRQIKIKAINLQDFIDQINKVYDILETT